MDQQKAVQLAVTIAVVAVVLAVRIRRMSGIRPLKLETLWIVPAIYAAVAVLALVGRPPAGVDWLWIGLAAAVGAGIGWWRGSMMAITVDPETHRLNHRASPAAIVILFAIVFGRNLLREALPDGVPGLGLDGAGIADALLMLGLALIGVTRLELFVRGRRLLRQAQAGLAPVF